jgi:hypothetical protein
MPKFKVTGYAYLPVMCTIEVEARNSRQAEAIAFEKWRKSERKADFIVPNSTDETAIHTFEPTQVSAIS